MKVIFVIKHIHIYLKTFGKINKLYVIKHKISLFLWVNTNFNGLHFKINVNENSEYITIHKSQILTLFYFIIKYGRHKTLLVFNWYYTFEHFLISFLGLYHDKYSQWKYENQHIDKYKIFNVNIFQNYVWEKLMLNNLLILLFSSFINLK